MQPGGKELYSYPVEDTVSVQEIRAHIHFLSTEEGGRRNPIFSGYRPPLNFGSRWPSGEPMLNDGIVLLDDREQVLPGEECDVRIRLLRPEIVTVEIEPGLQFDVTEGARKLVGHGVVTELLSIEPDIRSV